MLALRLLVCPLSHVHALCNLRDRQQRGAKTEEIRAKYGIKGGSASAAPPAAAAAEDPEPSAEEKKEGCSVM